MSVQQVNPFSIFRTSYNTVKNQKTQASQVKTAKTESNINNKKLLKTTTRLTFTLLALALGYYILKPAGGNKEVNNIVNSAKKHIKKITQESQGTFNEIVKTFNEESSTIPSYALFKVTLAQDGNMQRKLIRIKDQNIMEEYSQNGKLLKRTIFKKNKVLIQKDYSALENGEQKWDEVLTFIDGKLSVFEKGYKKLANGTEQWDKITFFEDGKPSLYALGAEIFQDSYKYATTINFKNGKPAFCMQDIIKLQNGETKYAEKFVPLGKGWFKA